MTAKPMAKMIFSWSFIRKAYQLGAMLAVMNLTMICAAQLPTTGLIDPARVIDWRSPGAADKPGKGVHFYEVKANDTVNGKAVTSAPSNIIKVVVQ